MTSPPNGKVYIASMNMRGEWAKSPENTIKLNVTSAQAKASLDRHDFSPMTEIKGGYEGFWNFESYWQSGKVFENIPREKTLSWWKNTKTPKRRYPYAKGAKVLHAEFDDFPNEKMDYITSRKKVYVPKYYDMIKDTERLSYWKQVIASGKDVVIYDFDGPRKADRNVDCLQADINVLLEKINDVKSPFGHGFVVAACLSGFLPDDYCI